jgi:hypothetical protein
MIISQSQVHKCLAFFISSILLAYHIYMRYESPLNQRSFSVVSRTKSEEVPRKYGESMEYRTKDVLLIKQLRIRNSKLRIGGENTNHTKIAKNTKWVFCYFC